MSIVRPGLEQIDESGATDQQVPGWDQVNGIWVPGDVVRTIASSDGSVLVDDSDPQNIDLTVVGGGGGGSLTVQDEGGTVATGVTQLDFQGAGVTAAVGTGEVVITIPGGSGGSVETYDAAIAAVLTGKVHRWKFDDASGASVADSVGSLTLTLSGTYTRHVASPTGFGTTFGASAVATSSGLGSLPVGNADRCFIILFRSNSEARQELVNYGPTGSTRQQWFNAMNVTGGNLAYLQVWSDDLNKAVQTVRGPIEVASGTDWHLIAFGYKASAQTTYVYYDGSLVSRRLGGTLNTGTSGNLTVSASANPLVGDLDDILVLNNWPGKAALDRLLAAAAGLIYTP